MSPQAVFTCPPCSVRLPQQGTEPPRRLTYCSITAPKQKLHGFCEIPSSSLRKEKEFQTFSAEIQDASSAIIHLELLSSDEEDAEPISNKLLAIHRDGEIRCFSDNLHLEEWKMHVNSGPGGISVEFAQLVTLEEAQKSLLRNREDIIALLGDITEMQGVHIMLLVTRASQMASKQDSTTSSLRIIRVGASKGTHIPIVELASITLPEVEGLSSENFGYSWHGASGSLLQHTSKTLSIHDLNGSVPRLRNHLKLRGDSFTSCLRLSPSTVALSREESIFIVDTKYQSLQARCLLEISSNHFSEAEQHKSHKNNTRNDFRLTSYFPHLDLVTALRGRELVAIQLANLKQYESGSRKRKRDSLLINALGRAFSSKDKLCHDAVSSSDLPKALGKFLPSCRSLAGWTKQKEVLDKLLRQEDFNAFERIMAAELGIAKRGTASSSKGHFGDSFHPSERQSVDFDKIYYVLTKVFSVEKHHESSTHNRTATKLKILWFPLRICRWLISQGHFSPSQVEAALKLYDSLSPDESLKVGEYTQAIIEWDKTLQTIQLILKSPVSLEIKEIAHCLSHLLRVANSGEKNDKIKLLTNNDILAVDRPVQKLQKTIAIDSVSPLQEIDRRSAVYDLLDSILIRLNAHARSTICQALRAELSSLELRSLANLLRLKLAQGQWLSSYVETTQNESNDESPKNDQITTIATILSCVIDGLGTGGWILGASVMEDLTETADTIAYMKAEISAALEGIEEATSLKGMLGEILLFDKNSRSQNQNLLPMDQFVSQARSSTANVSESRETLPFGLRVTHIAPEKRVGAGGEIVKRSKRDIEMLKSQIVGKYSFDRISI